MKTKLQTLVMFVFALAFISACRMGQLLNPTLTSTPTSTLTATVISTNPPASTPIGGGLIAFLNPPDSNICFIHVDGSDRTCLDVKGSDQPAWSPNGKQIVFFFYTDDKSGLFVINANGSNIAQITHITQLDRYPSWSPDGRQIAFSGTNGIVYVINADGTNATRVTNVVCMYPSWSPDGKYIAVAGTTTGLSDSSGCNDSGIYIMNADGSKKVLVTKLLQGYVYDIAWSPNGKHIIFTSDMDAPPKADWSYRDIYSINVDGSNFTRLTHDGHGGSTLSWSPDSKYIAFDNFNNEEHKWLIRIMNSDGSNITTLTDGSYPAWQP